MRAQLRDQLNVILETRETSRGLIVNLSDVLFDSASSNLKSGAREKLARVSEILRSHPGLQLAIEGHTDSIGTELYNQGSRSSARIGSGVFRGAEDRAGRRRHGWSWRKPARRKQRHRDRTTTKSTRGTRGIRRRHRPTLTYEQRSGGMLRSALRGRRVSPR